MNKSKERKVLKVLMAALMLGITLPCASWAKIGLAARFGDVIVENAVIGQTYNLREVLKIPFGIENKGSSVVDVLVEIEPPEKSLLKEPYEAIPDPSWVKTFPGTLKIGPGSQGFFDLLLTIPNDPSLNGRHFVAIIKARTDATGLLGVAVENKLRFSIGKGPESLKEEKRQKAMAQLDFDVSPQALYVVDVPVGVKFDAKKEQNKSIRVANYSPDVLSIQLSSSTWDSLLFLPPGYEAIPDPGWISFKEKSADIASEEIRMFSPVIHIPNDPKYKGKKFAAVIRSGLKTGFWLDAPVRLYITVKE